VANPGYDDFKYTVADAAGNRATGNLRVEVVPADERSDANAAPHTEYDWAGVLEGDGAAVVIDVLANDVDSDGDRLMLVGVRSSGVSDYANGTAEVRDGKVLYHPNADFAVENGPEGYDGLEYTVADANGEQARGTVLIAVVAADEGATGTAALDVLL
jgi:large repetitive protein